MGILIENCLDNEEINHSLVMIQGKIECVFYINDKITVLNEANGIQHSWPVRENVFKIYVQLHLGNNKLLLKCRSYSLNFTINYVPLKNRRKIRLVYLKCKDGDGRFQAPPKEDNSVESACSRISLAAQMLQMFTAEKLKEHNFPKKTFCLEEDCKNCRPICHLFTSELTTREARSLSQEELWNYFAKELMMSPLANKNIYKFLAFASFTLYDNPTGIIPQNHKDVLKLTRGYVALGGGGLALFGTGCLHTWAASLQEIVQRFTDQRVVDRKKYLDDSGNRKRYWACYSTGIGATLHELGHTFDLGHSPDGIMGHGFNNINKFFAMSSWPKGFFAEQVTVQLTTIQDVSWAYNNSNNKLNKNESNISVECNEKPLSLPHISDSSLTISNIESEAFWSRSAAVILNYHKWLNPLVPAECIQPPILNGSKIISCYGIRIIEFRTMDGLARDHWEFLEKEGPKEIQLEHSDLINIFSNECTECSILVEDNYGRPM
ncbi:uncharacterized protein [Centruroides vittatus]|uniref:uncharacterized protein isoform X2 n=1 Tax=Centruroides vittatus TaxID=120091 RepID=UPI003510636C